MLKQIPGLGKRRQEHRSKTLQGRLILFFFLLIGSILLVFTILLSVFGITGSGRSAVQKYFDSVLSYTSNAIESDMENLAATGILLAQSLSDIGDTFFSNYNMSAGELSNRSDVTESLIDELLPTLISTAENNVCGGTFVILDTSVSSEGVENKRAGFFLKKTQPVSTSSLTAKTYCLRGSAFLAREYGLELLGQWGMEFNESELDFFHKVMETTKNNPDLPLSRLYFWSDRTSLKNNNSETGLLLCIPLISSDNTCWGICGIEVSDRMFKQLYSPKEDEYQGVFITLSPRSSDVLYTERGLIAGNNYLTGNQMRGSLSFTGIKHSFPCFEDNEKEYSGSFKNIRLYSMGSPYEKDEWSVVVLMPKKHLDNVIKGNSVNLFFIFVGLLIFSLIATIFVSNRYLNPIKRGISSIREKEYETGLADFGVLEIDSLFEDLASDIREHKDEINRLALEKQKAEAQIKEVQTQIEKAQTKIERLKNKHIQDIDPEEYKLFLENLEQLTITEKRIFELYLEGKTTEEILEAQNIKENTLIYHNRNIFGKLGVTSRKQLLQFATIMQEESVK